MVILLFKSESLTSVMYLDLASTDATNNTSNHPTETIPLDATPFMYSYFIINVIRHFGMMIKKIKKKRRRKKMRKRLKRRSRRRKVMMMKLKRVIKAIIIMIIMLILKDCDAENYGSHYNPY